MILDILPIKEYIKVSKYQDRGVIICLEVKRITLAESSSPTATLSNRIKLSFDNIKSETNTCDSQLKIVFAWLYDLYKISLEYR